MRLLLALIGTAHGAADVMTSPETVAGLETKETVAGLETKETVVGLETKGEKKTSDGVLATMALFDVKHQAPHFDLCKLSMPVKIASLSYQIMQALYRLIDDMVLRGHAFDGHEEELARLRYSYLYTESGTALPSKSLQQLKFEKIRAFFSRGSTEEFTGALANIFSDILSMFVYSKDTDCESIIDSPTRMESRKKWKDSFHKNLEAIGDCTDVAGSLGFGIAGVGTQQTKFLRVVAEKRVISECSNVLKVVLETRFPKSKNVLRFSKYIQTGSRIADELLRSFAFEDLQLGKDEEGFTYKVQGSWKFLGLKIPINKVTYVLLSWFRGVISTQETFLEEAFLFVSMIVSDVAKLVPGAAGRKILLAVARFFEAFPYLIKLFFYAATSKQKTTLLNDHFYFNPYERLDPANEYNAFRSDGDDPAKVAFKGFFNGIPALFTQIAQLNVVSGAKVGQ